MKSHIGFRYSGRCSDCETPVRFVRVHVDNGSPEAIWVRCNDCSQITRIPYIGSDEIDFDND
jgi:RNase P subunit RPR2